MVTSVNRWKVMMKNRLIGGIVLAIGLCWLVVACGSGNDDLADLRERGYAFSVEEFHRAAERGEVEAVAAFLRAGMAVDVRSGDGHTALELAAGAGRAGVVDLLARTGARIEPEEDGARSAAMMAAASGSAETLEVLRGHGADLRRRDGEGWHALLVAASEGHGEAVDVLVPHVAGEDLDDALLMAALHGDVKTTDTLLRGGASVLARDAQGRTALMLAARYGQVDTVRLLLENGANRFSVDPGSDLTAAQMTQVALQQAEEEENAELGESLKEIVALLNSAPRADEVAGNIKDPRELVAIDAEFVPGPIADRYISDRVVRYGQRLHDATVTTERSGFAGISEALQFSEYRERPLPLRIESVAGDHAVVRKLFGSHGLVTVEVGDRLPGTDLVVRALHQRIDQTQIEGGEPSDVSVVEVAVSGSPPGVMIELEVGKPARRGPPYAVVRVGSDLYKARPGDVFLTSRDGDTQFRVVDIRPTQLLLENALTGGTYTLQRTGRNNN